ncbi:MAG: MoxR family ATPase [Gammaproteobacteria bacterium]
MSFSDPVLSDWRDQALRLEQAINQTVVGQQQAIRLLLIAVFARGHALLEGDVGVGKTTLLRTLARGLGGAYSRAEGTIDLMPNDLIYHTFIDSDGQPRIEPGPLLQHAENLSIFFFNEVNRARPQVHSLLLRVMAERSASAFNREYRFPHLLVFADRNRVEREETFELPSAARDRFLMEILITLPDDPAIEEELMFSPRFHDVDSLIEQTPEAILAYNEINDIGRQIQTDIQTSDALRHYALDLCRATRRPAAFGVQLPEVDLTQLIQAGTSPRGMSYLMRAARVSAWLEGRTAVLPEDIHTVFFPTIAHRVFFNPVYELRRAELAGELLGQILQQVAAP